MTLPPQKIPSQMFTAEELQRHADNLPLITATAAKYLDDIYADHVEFYEKWGVSKYFGNRRTDYATKEGRIQALKKYGKPTNLANQQKGTACVLLAMQALEQGLAAAGMESIWTKINNILKINNSFRGTDLQIMLQQLGWKIYYWNPSPDKNAEWDEEEHAQSPPPPGKKWNPVWGAHETYYNNATKRGVYIDIRVNDAKSLVGFGTKPPPAFRKVPFFIGTAHAGYHVFPGRKGEVIEAHSMRDLNDSHNLEFSPFNPLAPGGGPRWTKREKYRSGLIAVPEGF